MSACGGFVLAYNLGNFLALGPNRHLLVDMDATVDPVAVLSLRGGTFSTGSLTNNGNVLLSGPTALLDVGTMTNNGEVNLNNGSAAEFSAAFDSGG